MIEKLRGILLHGDKGAPAPLVHDLHGTAASLGFPRLAEVLERFEAVPEAESFCAGLAQAADETIAELAMP
jgi:HPt (histidine-containing phosphotransfer) domain-containing protein